MPNTTNSNVATETRHVPAAAFEFTEPCELIVGNRQDDLSPISILARSPEPIDHWYWGKLVHDLDGMQHPEKIALDYCHDQYEPLGFGNDFQVTDKGLTVSGSIVHQHEGDMADKVTHKAGNGVPFEASIFFSSQPEDLRIEFVPEGAFATANAREYEGPIYIARESFLRGLAVCLYGYDRHTQSRLSSTDPDRTIDVLIQHQEAPMSTKTNRTKLTDDEANPDATQKATATADAENTGAESTDAETSGDASTETTKDGQKSTSSDATASAADDKTTDAAGDAGTLTKSELKAYVEAFGAENGSQWALAGKPLAECHQLHAQTLETQLAATQKETEELKQNIASLSTGEDDPATFSPDAKDATTHGGPPAPTSELAANVGEGLAKLCAANPMPKD